MANIMGVFKIRVHTVLQIYAVSVSHLTGSCIFLVSKASFTVLVYIRKITTRSIELIVMYN